MKINGKILRKGVQTVFALLTLWIGIKFILFVNFYTNFEQGTAVSRPGGVEAFLPISALVSLRAWLSTGIFDPIHPAGLVIFLGAIFLSFMFKKAFCAWLCPIGTLSEGLARMGKFFFGRNFKLPRFLDYPLRGLKYLLFLFFFVSVFLSMTGPEALGFLNSGYNKVADVKMLLFFQSLSGTALVSVGALVILSVLFENFWCRYLCPYGALLGIISVLSPFKVSRSQEACTGCQACTRSCPNRINVAAAKRVWSPECTGCQQCVQACPVPQTLRFKTRLWQKALSPLGMTIAVLGVWLAFVVFAKATGHWQTSLTSEDFRTLIPQAGSFSH